MTRKKKHHYVPISYLNAYCADDGMLTVYRKPAAQSFRSAPNAVAFHDYYYAQPIEGGGLETNKLEDLFATLEGKWPEIVARMSSQSDVNGSLEDIFAFIALQRARVPAARDAFEKMLAVAVKTTAKRLDAQGQLPPAPKGYENILELAEISIDPHQSIHAMTTMIKAMGQIFDRIGLAVLINDTEVKFVTSDNPVIYFNPLAGIAEAQPYALGHGSEVALIMPVSPRLLILGNAWDKSRFASQGIEYRHIQTGREVEQFNELIIKYGYAAIISQDALDGAIVARNSSVSPILSADIIPARDGDLISLSFQFGPLEKKPKWRRDK